MNKVISTPIAIIIIVVLSVLVGGITAWQCLRIIEIGEVVKVFPEGVEEVEEVLLKDEITGWNIYRNLKYGFEFRYPSDFFWFEPKIMSIECEYANFSEECPYIKVKDSKVKKEQALEWVGYKIKQVTINDIPYCSWSFSESGAGSHYVNYYYSTVKEKECFVVRLVVRYASCGVYLPGEDAYEECKYENNVTKPETLNKVLSTFKFVD